MTLGYGGCVRFLGRRRRGVPLVGRVVVILARPPVAEVVQEPADEERSDHATAGGAACDGGRVAGGLARSRRCCRSRRRYRSRDRAARSSRTCSQRLRRLHRRPASRRLRRLRSRRRRRRRPSHIVHLLCRAPHKSPRQIAVGTYCSSSARVGLAAAPEGRTEAAGPELGSRTATCIWELLELVRVEGDGAETAVRAAVGRACVAGAAA
jgi:hypothetical protein